MAVYCLIWMKPTARSVYDQRPDFPRRPSRKRRAAGSVCLLRVSGLPPDSISQSIWFISSPFANGRVFERLRSKTYSAAGQLKEQAAGRCPMVEFPAVLTYKIYSVRRFIWFRRLCSGICTTRIQPKGRFLTEKSPKLYHSQRPAKSVIRIG